MDRSCNRGWDLGSSTSVSPQMLQNLGMVLFNRPSKNIHDIPWWSSCGDGRLIGWTPHDFSKSLMHALGWRHLYFSEPCSLFLSLQLRFNGCSWCSSHCAPADVLSSLPLFIRLWDSMSKGSILFTCAMDAMDAMKLDGMNVVTVHPTMADTFLAHVWLSLKTCLRRLCVLESQGAESSSCAIPHKHYLYLSLSIYLASFIFWILLAKPCAEKSESERHESCAPSARPRSTSQSSSAPIRNWDSSPGSLGYPLKGGHPSTLKDTCDGRTGSKLPNNWVLHPQ